MSTPTPGPMLRKVQASSTDADARNSRLKRTGEDGEKGSKIQRQVESRTQNALAFLGIMSLLFVVAMVKLRHNPSISVSHHRMVTSLRAIQHDPPAESHALEEVTRSDHAIFIPPHSIYSLSIPDIRGEMVSLKKFHGMVTLIVNVACL